MARSDRAHAAPRLRPLDAALGDRMPGATRVAPRASSLSAMAAELLAEGPLDPVALMRAVCRTERLQPDAAARMADVLLGSRVEFVQLDDDRWALVRDGHAVLHRDVHGATRPATAADAATGEAAPPDEAPDGEPAPTAAGDALRAAAFAVVDVETTGSQPGLHDRVTEIAIVPVDQGAVGEPWSQLVHPGRSIPPMITALTGISDAMVAHAPTFSEIADEVRGRLEGRIFTAHNAPFDHRFVEAELARSHGLRLDGGALCTVRLTRRLVPALSRRSLDRVCAYFGVRIDGRHRAGGDALATAQVLVRLLGIAEERGVHTWPQLVQTLSPSARRGTRGRRSLPTSVSEDSTA
jgi:DNA polymerase-3 subunit epsilon